MGQELEQLKQEATNALANISIQMVQLRQQIERDNKRLESLTIQERELSGKIEGLEMLSSRLSENRKEVADASDKVDGNVPI